MWIHQLIVKCCYSMECLRKVWSCMRRSLHPSRYCVSCRFCQNSFCHFYQPPCVPEKKSCRDGRGESGNPGEVLEKLFVGDHGETDEDAGNKQTSNVRVSMLFFVLPRWRSAGLSCRVSFSQRFSGKTTGVTDFVWVGFWHRSTSAMWIFKSSYLISFWFAGVIWRPLIFSIS